MSQVTHDDAHEGHAHASPGFYWMIGGILAVLTAVEVALFYIKPPGEQPLLLILSAVKFVMVIGYFMHLKFDSKIFTGVFVAGLTLAVFMVTALVVLYHHMPVTPVPVVG